MPSENEFLVNNNFYFCQLNISWYWLIGILGHVLRERKLLLRFWEQNESNRTSFAAAKSLQLCPTLCDPRDHLGNFQIILGCFLEYFGTCIWMIGNTITGYWKFLWMIPGTILHFIEKVQWENCFVFSVLFQPFHQPFCLRQGESWLFHIYISLAGFTFLTEQVQALGPGVPPGHNI